MQCFAVSAAIPGQLCTADDCHAIVMHARSMGRASTAQFLFDIIGPATIAPRKQ
jgi:hypothetical protein